MPALLNERITILGIDVGLLVLSDKLLGWLPVLHYTLPWYLLSNWNAPRTPVGIMTLMLGRSIDQYTPTLVVVAMECVLFVLITVWRFNRDEL